VQKDADDQDQVFLEEWLSVLSRLWTAYDKPIDANRLTLYRDMLARIPLGLLERAIDRAVQEHMYNSVPTVAEVWQAVRKELGNPYDIEQGIQEWCDRRWRQICVEFPAVQAVAAETESVA